MARVVLVHGAFNELWGPNELKARWLPALRDGLWHCGVTISDDDVAVCFYGDLFRRAPGTEAERRLEQSRAGFAEALSDLAGGDAIAALGQAANDAAFERTVDMVTIMATVPDVREQMRVRAERVVGDETRVVVAHSLGTLLSYQALCHHPQWPVHTFVTLGSPLASPAIFEHLDPPADRRAGRVAGVDSTLGQRASRGGQGGGRAVGRAIRPACRGGADRQRPPGPRSGAVSQRGRHRRRHRRRTRVDVE